MSIASAISDAQTKVAAAYTACNDKGATMPAAGSQNLSNLASTISSIPSGGGDGLPAWLKDGDTHMWIDIRNSYQLDQQLRIRMIGTIDWGDGTAAQSVSVTAYTTFTHTYATTGKYRIDLHPTSGTFYLGGASTTYNVMGTRATRTNVVCALYQVEIGTSRITTISQYAFYYCYGLVRVYVPKTITTIGQTYAFGFCYSLAEVEFQDYSTITSTAGSFFYGCYALQEIHGFAPPAQATIGSTYRYCAALSEITIPASVTNISSYGINGCSGLRVIHCLPTTPPTIADANAFAPPSACVIEVPSASLAAYQAANIWSTYASQMVGV